jgi:hypothetical protein
MLSNPLPLPGNPFAGDPPAGAAAHSLGSLPLSFVPNAGQADPQVSFHLQGAAGSVWFTPAGVTMALPGEDGADPWVAKLDFAGARPVEPVGTGATGATVGYFTGPQESWRTGIPAYSGITYPDLWPGIDLEYSGDAGKLKYQFVVHPGADPSQIRLAWRGVDSLAVTGSGALAATTPNGGFTDDKPYTYQPVDGRQVEVASSYAVGKPAGGSHPYGFNLGTYDPALPLVIDPAIEFAGYIGGTGFEHGLGVDVDSSGAAYVAGETNSGQATFPATTGFDTTYNGGGDAFVAKIAPGGSAVEWSAYLGGSNFDQAFDVAVDDAGAAYLTGQTISTNFPRAGGGTATFFRGGAHDAFVAKIAPGGGALEWSGYLGGHGDDRAQSIAVDSAGAAYLGGMTSSSQLTFPVTAGPDLTYGGGAYDAFVAKVKPDGSGLEYSGYIGGSGDDQGYSVAVDSSGAAYLGGQTSSSETTFPAVGGPELTYNGSYDGFVAKVNPAGTGLDYAGYVGGVAPDGIFGIALDSAGAAYVTGATLSPQGTFPLVGGLDATYAGGLFDGFVAKINPAGTGLDYSGFIGGSGYDVAWGIDVDAAGAAYVTGETASNQSTFPVSAGPDSTYNGGSVDAFVTRVDAAGSAFTYSGYVGGAGYDQGLAIAVDGTGAAFVSGETSSGQASFPDLVGPDLSYNGGSADAFLAKIGP